MAYIPIFDAPRDDEAGSVMRHQKTKNLICHVSGKSGRLNGKCHSAFHPNFLL